MERVTCVPCIVAIIAIVYLTYYESLSDEIDTSLQVYLETEWVNENEVALTLNYTDVTENMFDRYQSPFIVEYDRRQSCYIVFNDTAKDKYTSITSDVELNKINPLAYLHHHGPCGLCSNLRDFSVYKANNNLASRVRSCAINIFRNKRKCIENIGFTKRCAAVWFWNTENTAKNCGLTCFKHLLLQTPPNVEIGGINYCETCSNSLGDHNVCTDFQWQKGPMRLNECLQCDECNSGAIFARYAGGCRKAYGLPASINRPKPSIPHDYFD